MTQIKKMTQNRWRGKQSWDLLGHHQYAATATKTEDQNTLNHVSSLGTHCLIASAAISHKQPTRTSIDAHEHHVGDFDEQTKSTPLFQHQHIAYYFPASAFDFLRKPYRFLAHDLRKSYQIPTPNLLDARPETVLVSKLDSFWNRARKS